MSDTRPYLSALYIKLLDEHGNLADDVEVEVRSFRPNKAGPLHRYRAGTTVEAVAGIIEADASRGDVYNGVHVRHRGAGKGGDANVAKLVALFCDIDCDKAEVTREVADAAMANTPWGPPSMVVESGGGRHGYWIYEAPLDAGELHADHRRASAWLRAWLNLEFGVDAADDMSSRDRILRTAGTLNRKNERRLADGSHPEARIVSLEPARFIKLEDVLETIPPGFDPTPHAKKSKKRLRPSEGASGQPLTSAELPTSVPERVRRVLARGGIR